ncbi:MAG: DUF4433 domain-containing protein [Myxococcota bacterium]
MLLKGGTHHAIFRIVHLDNLAIYLARRALHAPNHTPNDGRVWKGTHDAQVQTKRAATAVPCGPGGTLLDYVPFYFGPRSPMLYKLKTGQVAGYDEGQEPLVTLVAAAEDVAAAVPFVFYDGHALAAFSTSYADLARLPDLDWAAIDAKMWRDTPEDNDRQRRKQAEFLVHRELSWALIRGLAVCNDTAKTRVEALLSGYDPTLHRRVAVWPDLYY